MQLIENLLSVDEAASALNCLRPETDEIQYGQYYAIGDNQSLIRLPRLMAFQASTNSCGDQPWYRCKIALVPQNNIVYTSWTPTVQKLKRIIEEMSGETWNLAHIIYYKDGQESMGLHSDCMLDLASGSKIAVVSLGVNRQMDLVKKQESTLDGPSQLKINLPGNSLFLLDEETNRHYVHGIKKEKSQIGERISIVFRHVLTYKTQNGKLYGNGLTYSTKQDIIQGETRQKIYKFAFAFFLALCLNWMFPFFSTNMFKLISGGIYWLCISLVIELVQQTIGNYIEKNKNKQLQKLCKLKNFKTWDQNRMRDFLKYNNS
ncbi:unnamed protein product [Adineta steineri]|uniref:Fe2OG dioxygenase domain-containing protein n=3 Tax=Adineta steineri TaxID=433720 RepID=A0A814AW15_9BILA|nr:unnamed protein product [Adineta steineri]